MIDDIRTVSPAGVLAVAAFDFGWGSFGKLRLILNQLQNVTPVFVGEQKVAITVNQLLDQPLVRYDGQLHEVDAALVINDPRAADKFTIAGVPVVYVDSLPYLWTTKQEVPQSVDTYCAQRVSGGVPEDNGPLAGRNDIVWVDPIVPIPRRRTARHGAIVNVGGLHSHLSGRVERSYLKLVLEPLVKVLADSDAPVVAVCGNLDAEATAVVAENLPDAAVGMLPGAAFEDLVAHAGVLITSPGSTTLLQAAAAGTGTVLLPPQNLSQILNTNLLGIMAHSVVDWPAAVLDPRAVDALRPQGEDAVLAYIYDRITAAAERPELCTILMRRLETAIAELGSRMVKSVGRIPLTGAAQVADEVRRVLGERARRL
jgi:hydroxymethylcytosylglucuronate/cytosylglucuronate synthase